MRNTWDRACWLDMQAMIARILGQIADFSTPAGDDEARKFGPAGMEPACPTLRGRSLSVIDLALIPAPNFPGGGFVQQSYWAAELSKCSGANSSATLC
jgi:hypothetical protein